MVVKASIKNLRISPRKVRIVANAIRGKNVQEALGALTFCRKSSALPLAKLVKSAVANAEVKGGIDVDNLFIKELLVDAGPTMKRWMPRARGMATPVLKRSSRISITLEEK